MGFWYDDLDQFVLEFILWRAWIVSSSDISRLKQKAVVTMFIGIDISDQ